MGYVFSKLWSKLFNSDYKVLLVGLDNAGKSTILYKLFLGETITTTPTIGSNVETIVYRNVKFCMWDLGGQDSFRSSWSSFYNDTNCICLVVDSSDKERMEESKIELINMLQHEHLAKAKLLVFANKQDMKNALSISDISNALGLSSIKDHTYSIQGCCALTGKGLYEGLDFMVSNL